LEKLPNALERATQLASALSQSLAPAVDPATVSVTAKIPFKVLLLRELFAYRVAELGVSACELFHVGRTIGAIILTRAALESVSGLYMLDRRVKKCLEEKSLGGFPTFVSRLLLGSRSPDAEHKAYNVLDAIDEVDKLISGYRAAYDRCSEFAHPNADGMINSYGRMDRKTLLFNLDPKKYQVPVDGIVPILAGSLELFIQLYNAMPSYLLDFAKLCEAALKTDEV
jgi:hypothetical protein